MTVPPVFGHASDSYRLELSLKPEEIRLRLRMAVNQEDPGYIGEFPPVVVSVDGKETEGHETPMRQIKDADGSWYEIDQTYSTQPGAKQLSVTLDPDEMSIYVVIVRHADGHTSNELLSAQEPLLLQLQAATTSSIKAGGMDSESSGGLFLPYVRHGIWHILSGYDHMLFMAALVMAAGSLWDLVKVVTSFTLAHTLTLTLSVLDLFRLNERIVEPMIAASIVFVAVQNIVAPKASRGWTRFAVAFGFGLFHGLGFAGGLLETMAGLRGSLVWAAILAFSIGVELGHQVVVVPLYTTRQLVRKAGGSEQAELVSRKITRLGSSLIALAGLYYFVVSLLA